MSVELCRLSRTYFPSPLIRCLPTSTFTHRLLVFFSRQTEWEHFLLLPSTFPHLFFSPHLLSFRHFSRLHNTTLSIFLSPRAVIKASREPPCTLSIFESSNPFEGFVLHIPSRSLWPLVCKTPPQPRSQRDFSKQQSIFLVKSLQVRTSLLRQVFGIESGASNASSTS